MKDSFVCPAQYTYKDMSRPEKRDLMSHCCVASLGTQSGGFGRFTEEFRVVSFTGIGNIRNEIECLSKHLNVDYQYMVNGCPTLKELLS